LFEINGRCEILQQAFAIALPNIQSQQYGLLKVLNLLPNKQKIDEVFAGSVSDDESEQQNF
jgi:hypothetical protein